MGLIHEYGLHWKASEVDWDARTVQLLGHGKWYGEEWAADFAAHRGVYAIYRDGALYYVGLTKKQGIGPRLKQHRSKRKNAPEKLRDEDEFSWFGFDRLANFRTDKNGLLRTKRQPLRRIVDPLDSINDWEAVLILVADPSGNIQKPHPKATQWQQATRKQRDDLMARHARS